MLLLKCVFAIIKGYSELLSVFPAQNIRLSLLLDPASSLSNRVNLHVNHLSNLLFNRLYLISLLNFKMNRSTFRCRIISGSLVVEILTLLLLLHSDTATGHGKTGFLLELINFDWVTSGNGILNSEYLWLMI